MVPETYFTINQELLLFVYSIGFGLVFGAIYDVFRAIRQMFPHKFLLVFLEDCIFFIIYSIVLMCFAVMFSRSQVRFYYSIGNIAGFALYHFTIGKAVMHIICRIVLIFKSVFAFCGRRVLKITQKIKLCFVKNAENVRIDKEKHKSVLQNSEKVLYNNNGLLFDDDDKNYITEASKRKLLKREANKNGGKVNR